PPTWPVMVIVYSALTMLPCMVLLGLSTSRSKQADQAQRWLVRILTRYGPIGVRLLFLVAGVALFADAVVHHNRWW
ncbi:MAG: hypothetical protein EKK51_24245, partial [Mycolicibacterium sp.]